MEKSIIVAYLDEYLENSRFSDASLNGIQVDTKKSKIKKIGYAVDATSYIIEKAIQEKVDMLLVHHGIFWGNEQVLTGTHFERISSLIKNDIALYACHLPLDAHKTVGNNRGLLEAYQDIFAITQGQIEEFGEYREQNISFALRHEKKISFSDLTNTYADMLGLQKEVYNFGAKTHINSIAFVSGGGGGCLNEANKKGYDVFVTGEMNHSDICLAKELKQSILLGGHRETERLGPARLSAHLKERFGLEIVFLDEKY